MKWTEEQLQAIEEKGSNILVSAAAGSGKTAVLVERIIHKLMDEKLDITSLLVVTFTNASASEMRERILEAIYQKLEEDPDDAHLQRQITLLGKAHICTIHAFCLEVIRNHFYEISISPNFRIGDTAEIELLKQDVLEELFETKYEEKNENFLQLLEIYTGYRGDEPLKELLLKIYEYIQSSPFPEEWLHEQIEQFHIENKEQDFLNTAWGKILLEDFRDLIEETKIGLEGVKKDLEENPELEKFSSAIRLDIENLEKLIENTKTWNEVYHSVCQFSFLKWPVDRKIQSNIKDEAKIVRDKINKKFNSQKSSIFFATSEEANEDCQAVYEILKPLEKLILEFSEAFTQKKKEKNMITFHDIEHLALAILTKREEGKHIASEVAKEYQKQLEEIAIDEYQDSNLVQEYILSAVSRGNNMFMVGDVKQSIYKFRQARPELFLEKYQQYLLKKDKTAEDGLKIPLFKNFRSRENVLDFTNIVFQNIMSQKLGDIEYTQEEYLNLGAAFPEEGGNTKDSYIPEIHLIEMEEKEDAEEGEPEEKIENAAIEGTLVASKIQELLQSGFLVYDKKMNGYRKIRYKDIVILLRTTTGVAPIYESEMVERDIPVFSDTSTEYLESVEIQTIMALLKIMDNPIQDIPLVTVLRSMIGGFTDNDLIEIRLVNRNSHFYEAMLEAKIQVSEQLQKKIENFLQLLDTWRSYQEYLPLDELIWKIYQETGYYHYVGLMPNGSLRQANLKMLFERAKQYEKASFKGLFQFINFIDKLKLHSGDLSSAKLIGENEDVVRIMSIHKSKGLEFPVVFLCGTGKNINMQDLKDTILLHQDLGLGPKYINYERKLEYDTLAKEAIKRKLKREIISEEMRVLYVALTRAKEKLIITGLGKEILEDMEQKRKMIAAVGKIDKMPDSLVGSFKRYEDWILLAYIASQNDNVKLKVHQKKEIMGQRDTKKQEEINIWEEKKKGKANSQIAEKLSWKYPNMLATTMPSKISVTKLKELAIKKQISFDKVAERMLEKPNFMREDKEVSGAQRGTVTHLCLQRLDNRKDYTQEEIREEIQKMVAIHIITREEAEAMSIKQIWNFTQTILWEEMKQAKEIYKEVPFYRNIAAKDVLEEETEESMLLQGIMDLYYITAAGELVLVDYKTDYIEKEDSLREKYLPQLKLYKEALEEALNKKVARVYLYSTYFNKAIEVKIP